MPSARPACEPAHPTNTKSNSPPPKGSASASASRTYLAVSALDDTAYDVERRCHPRRTINAERDKFEALVGSPLASAASTSTYQSTSTSFADVDATNLRLDFTVPASRRVIVKCIARARRRAVVRQADGGVADR